MGGSGADANSPADRKQAERRRLAEALRANLGRRKAQSRDRRTRDDAAPAKIAGETTVTGFDPTREGAAHKDKTGD
jgi:hypothetical protein